MKYLQFLRPWHVKCFPLVRDYSGPSRLGANGMNANRENVRCGAGRNRYRTVACFCLALVAGVALSGCPGSKAVTTSDAASERIGVYDSRAIAVAYAGSDRHEAQLSELKAEYDAAKAAGDTARVAEIEAEAQAQQDEMHRQGFSTAPVDEILAQIKTELPRIQADADVVALVSKWDEAALVAHPNATQVDVTMALVDAFHPNDRQRKSAVEIQKHKPVPMEELEKHIKEGNI